MARSIRLSVIVPSHGRVDLFEQTLASIEAQTWDGFELIVADDSALQSDRETVEAAVALYRERTSRPARYIFTTANLGQAANTNQGLRAATGDILRILHSDDLVRPGCFEWEVQQFDRFPEINLMFQDCVPFRANDEIRWNQSPRVRIIEPADYFRQFLSTSTALPSGMLFSKRGFECVGGMREDWSFLCDWELFAKLLLRAIDGHQFVGYVAAGNYAWRLHEDSTSATKWRQHFAEHAELMKGWKESLHEGDGLFLDKLDRRHFFQRGDQYRNRRLIDDVSKLSGADLKAAMPWFRENLSSSLRRKVVWKSRRRIAKRKIRSMLGVARQPSSHSNQLTRAKRPRADDDWTPELVITPFHGDQDASFNSGADVGSGIVSVVVPFDNSINLYPLRNQIGRVQRIRISSLNLNRFYQLSLAECLKYVQPGTEVEFCFHDNQLMTWFGLKAALNRIAPGRFELTFQSQNPREGSAKGLSKWSLRYRCTRGDDAWHVEPLTGLTIGVLTLGDRMEELQELVRTAREHANVPYEIVLIGPRSLPEFEGADDIRQIEFSERDDMGWITRKKNLICETAAFTDIVVCHDRFEFTRSFFQAFECWGSSYGIAAVRLKLPDGKRGLDWGVVQGENHAWCQGGLLNYRDYSRYSYVPGGVTLIRKTFWQQFPWCEDLYWNEHEDVELCRRIQHAGHRIHRFPGTMIATRDRWIDENPLIDFSDQQDL